MTSETTLELDADTTVLVTGGAGFIGSALVRELIASTEATVVTVDALTYAGQLVSLESVRNDDRHHFVEADITDARAITEVFSRFDPDLVVHLAAETHVDRSIDDPVDFVHTNVVGTTVLLRAAADHHRTLLTSAPARAARFRFHHVSTDEVFGDLGSGSGCFDESSPYAPSSPYSASKAGADHLVRAWNRTYGLPVVISNCSNNFGPFQHPEKLIPLTILALLSGREVPVYGDGKQSRDWLFVEDHVRALKAVATRGEIGDTYIIGGGEERTNLGVVEVICDQLAELRGDSPDTLRRLIRFVDDRPGHDLRYAVSSAKISTQLGWSPRGTFESGLRTTVEWYLEHEDRWVGQFRHRRV